MEISLSWCDASKIWKWIITKTNRPILKKETGQNENIDDALSDILNTIKSMM